MRDFRKLEIWKQGIELVKEIYELTKKLPKEEKFALRSKLLEPRFQFLQI
jgi:hypothetical protein